MSENISAISVARLLHERELFFFTSRTLSDLLARSPSQVHVLVRQLVQTGLVAEVENGKYLLLGFDPERVLANPFFIAWQLVTPGYVSFWSALHSYGFTEQVPRTVFVATTKKKKPVEYAGQRFRFVTLLPRKFFGYRRDVLGDLPVLIADEAKALIDSFSEPDYAGGIAEVAKALRTAIATIDVAVLVDYANRFEDRTLGSRLGYLLGLLGCPVAPSDATPPLAGRRASMELIRSASVVKLDSKRPERGQRDARWRIDINMSSTEWLGEGVA